MNAVDSETRPPADPAQTDRPNLPAHELVYQRLKAQILFGEMAPGQPVTIQGLTQALGAGMTPVREAIRRLTSDGALTFQGNRRVSVPELGPDDLNQLIFIRKTIEPELAYRAAARVSGADVAQLRALDTQLDQAIAAGDVPMYLRRNYEFHASLYAKASAPVLAELADRIWLRFGPSLRVVCGRFGTASLPDRHKDLLAALVTGDAPAARRAMAQDVEQGMDLIATVFHAPEQRADSIDSE
ncbi:MAG: GntR family transcriptional regulator [Pseudomonadota bacterium]